MATSIVRYLQYGKHVPELIIVAPAYGTMMSDKETNYRERDYTFSKIERFVGSGGAIKYLKFFKNELISMIDSCYRTDSTRILNGYSLGGLFTFYIVATEPELFDNYIAGSPYLINDIDYLEETIKNSPSYNSEKRIFVSVGQLEDKNIYHEPINAILNALGSQKNILIKYREFVNGTHFTTPSEALTYGLRFLFDKNQLEEP
jgi:predicted alpha/beta superfamily hydrolase